MTMMKATTSPSPFPHDRSANALDPIRIRMAREAAGLSKVELARTLDVTPRTIANWEEDGAPAFQISPLASALDVMPSFLSVLPGSPAIGDLSEQQVWFRSLRRSTMKQRRSAMGHGRFALLFFQWIEDHFRLPACDLPYEDTISMSPEQAATTLRADWGYGENPLPSMMSLVEAHGIRLFSLPPIGKVVDAFSFVFNDTPYIAVDVQKTAERIRFDIAHEIGHLVMHTAAVSENRGADSMQEVWRDFEGEAHSFASNLLMPAQRVKGIVPNHATVPQLLEAKKYFRVSAMAMTRRAHDLGRLSDWEYRSACSELTARGYRTAEPGGMKPEQSQVFRYVARSNRGRGISTRTISEETGLTPGELHDLSFGNLLAVAGDGSAAQAPLQRYAVSLGKANDDERKGGTLTSAQVRSSLRVRNGGTGAER